MCEVLVRSLAHSRCSINKVSLGQGRWGVLFTKLGGWQDKEAANWCVCSLIHSSIHSFIPCLSLSTYYVLGPRPGPGHSFQDLLLWGGEADRNKQWQHQGKGNRGSHRPSCPRPAPQMLLRADA